MITNNSAVLFVDDNADYLNRLVSLFAKQAPDIATATARDAQACLKTALEIRARCAVVDLSLDDRHGPEGGLMLVGELTKRFPQLRIIVLTGHDSPSYGRRALEMGAASFLSKTDADSLVPLVRDAIRVSELMRDAATSASDTSSAMTLLGLSSKSPCMQRAIDEAAFASRASSRPVLLTGETGVGKNRLAWAIHKASGFKGKIVSVPTGRLNPDLALSELVGYKKGAFTGAIEDRVGFIEHADNGTLFIDEVDTLPHSTQVALLGILQDKSYTPIGSTAARNSNFRLITATNCPVNQLLGDKALREDFFYRIEGIKIEIPPLRERKEDIPDIAQQIVERLSDSEGYTIAGIKPKAIAWLKQQQWKGNVRSLEKAVENAYFRAQFSDTLWIDTQHLTPNSTNSPASTQRKLRQLVHRYERDLVEQELAQNGDNKKAACEVLGIVPAQIYRILRRGES